MRHSGTQLIASANGVGLLQCTFSAIFLFIFIVFWVFSLQSILNRHSWPVSKLSFLSLGAEFIGKWWTTEVGGESTNQAMNHIRAQPDRQETVRSEDLLSLQGNSLRKRKTVTQSFWLKSFDNFGHDELENHVNKRMDYIII